MLPTSIAGSIVIGVAVDRVARLDGADVEHARRSRPLDHEWWSGRLAPATQAPSRDGVVEQHGDALAGPD